MALVHHTILAKDSRRCASSSSSSSNSKGLHHGVSTYSKSSDRRRSSPCHLCMRNGLPCSYYARCGSVFLLRMCLVIASVAMLVRVHFVSISHEPGAEMNLDVDVLHGRRESAASPNQTMTYEGVTREALQNKPAVTTAVFYNVYVGDMHENATRFRGVLDIADEQLGEVLRHVDRIQSVHYVTIGSPRGAALFAEYLYQNSSFCNPPSSHALDHDDTKSKSALNCRSLGNRVEGHEVVTLQPLYEYCQKNPSHTVIYLHNKGSYHPDFPGQASWRKWLTKAATSDLCILNDPKDDVTDTCNVCGLVWTPRPQFHQTGNMWAAQCSYIKELRPPATYEQDLAKIINSVVIPLTEKNIVKFALHNYWPGAHTVGLGDRYAMEMWIGSHPTVRACCLSQSSNIDYWRYPGQHVLNETEFHRSPVGKRFNFTSDYGDNIPPGFKTVLSSPYNRKIDYFLLPGLLLKWQNLYPDSNGGTGLPPRDSWVFDFYPDGAYWKEQIYGNDTASSQPKLPNLRITDLLAQQYERFEKEKEGGAIPANDNTSEQK